MIANAITIIRLFLTFGVIALFGQHHILDIAIIFIIALIFTLDAVDGIVARLRNETSKLGEILDTLVDRIVENTFWIYFTTTGILPLWIPITIMTRGFLTDTWQRSFGYPKHGWTHSLTRSRISRALYGSLKMFTFMCLASTTTFKNIIFKKAGLILAILAIGFCLIRALPAFVDAYKMSIPHTGTSDTQESR